MAISKNKLSNLDIFGLVSGIVGLVADLIGLSALFGLTHASVAIPTTTWVTSLLLIIYTLLVAGFYARRLLCYINRQKIGKKRNANPVNYRQIELAAAILTSVLSFTLSLLFIYNVAQDKYNRTLLKAKEELAEREKEKIELLKTLKELKMTEEIERLLPAESWRTPESRAEESVFGIVYLSFFVAIGLTAVAVWGTREIYRACDPDYGG